MIFNILYVFSFFLMVKSNDDKNIYGDPLEVCCTDPVTGFYRNGLCTTGPNDHGKHVVCATVTDAFLAFSRSVGNDLSTPRPQYRFPGLKNGNCWCLCASRWKEAMEAGVAPPINLRATHESMLQYVPLHILERYNNVSYSQADMHSTFDVDGSKVDR